MSEYLPHKPSDCKPQRRRNEAEDERAEVDGGNMSEAERSRKAKRRHYEKCVESSNRDRDDKQPRTDRARTTEQERRNDASDWQHAI